ncbi:hypothetical protein HYV82_05195 [Candidatus Woesearchaeota archaeon]|nr:hypothetical protein [Candidatus Woesearchaeota archaeon]
MRRFALALVIALISAIVLISGCALSEAQAKEKIRKDLVGKQIEYYGIAGNKLVFEVNEENIISITQITAGSDGSAGGKPAEQGKPGEPMWQASVGSGKQPMWNLYYDSQGNFVSQKQLFVT